MRAVIWIVHISLDGFVANKDGRLDDFDSGEENLAFVTEICKAADTILTGRVTHDMLHAFWPQAGVRPGATLAEKNYSGWYNAAQKLVATRSPPGPREDGVSFISSDYVSFVQRAKCAAGKAMVIFGSPDMAAQLLRCNLVDVYWIFVNPVILGKGIPLFSQPLGETRLTLCETRRFANGETALKYMARR